MSISVSCLRQYGALGLNKCQKPCDKPHSRRCLPMLSPPIFFNRRLGILYIGTPFLSTMLNWNLAPEPVKAEESVPTKTEDEEGDDDVLGSVRSLFDPNGKTKTGKVLPKAYLKSAKEVVKTLRASLEEDPKDIAKFRRTADAAKESIRGYLNNWRGQSVVVAEESYAALEKAIRSLASFYSKSGPLATLPEEVKSGILNDLDTAEAFL